MMCFETPWWKKRNSSLLLAMSEIELVIEGLPPIRNVVNILLFDSRAPLGYPFEGAYYHFCEQGFD